MTEVKDTTGAETTRVQDSGHGLHGQEANTPTDSPPDASGPGLTGLERLRGMLQRGQQAPAGISVPLNFRLEQFEAGEALFTGTPLADHVNPAGTVHGGWYGALLDSAMACAVLSRLPAGARYTTLEYKVNIIRPIPLGTPVRATGTASHVGRSTGIATGEIRGLEDDRLYATGSTTCIVLAA